MRSIRRWSIWSKSPVHGLFKIVSPRAFAAGAAATGAPAPGVRGAEASCAEAKPESASSAAESRAWFGDIAALLWLLTLSKALLRSKRELRRRDRRRRSGQP